MLPAVGAGSADADLPSDHGRATAGQAAGGAARPGRAGRRFRAGAGAGRDAGRGQDGEPAPHAPPPALARLGDLAGHAAAAGLQVRAVTSGTVRELPFGVDQAAFRIVQEALTNVTRHAGTDTATVRVRYGQHDLTVQVDDDGQGGHGGLPLPGGSGIAGMRERAAALGGELLAGPRPEGGFRVTATLPLDGSE